MRGSAFVLVSALALLSQSVVSAPATDSDQLTAPRVHDGPAWNKGSRYFGPEKRQYHNADYGSSEQPSASPSTAQATPTPTPSSVSGKTRRAEAKSGPIEGKGDPVGDRVQSTKRQQTNTGNKGQVRYGHAVPLRERYHQPEQGNLMLA
jgi:hypothetical protein